MLRWLFPSHFFSKQLPLSSFFFVAAISPFFTIEVNNPLFENYSFPRCHLPCSLSSPLQKTLFSLRERRVVNFFFFVIATVNREGTQQVFSRGRWLFFFPPPFPKMPTSPFGLRVDIHYDFCIGVLISPKILDFFPFRVLVQALSPPPPPNHKSLFFSIP